jgi:hypothetical protein
VKSSPGKCLACNQTFDKGNITKHLATCEPLKKAWPSSSIEGFHIIVSHAGYWLHLAAPVDLTLERLDSFLRDIWLECCGHMSAFTIGSQRYLKPFERGMDERSMKVAIGKVLAPKMKFLHEYDFGSITELTLVVNGPWQMPERKRRGVVVLARNDPPEMKCMDCGEAADQICSQCSWRRPDAWVCSSCAEDHDCGEDMLLPGVNSPRVGVCAYTG